METGQRRSSGPINVLMFPWLAHGHISPFLELAKKLTTRNFRIHFCSTPVNINSIKPKLPPKYSTSIQFVELHLPSLPELPPHYHTTKGLPTHLMPTLKKAFDMASPSFYNILKSLKPDLLLYDFIQPWAPVLASSLNIPAVHFLCSSASMTSFIAHIMKNPDQDYPFPAINSPDYVKYWNRHDLESNADGGVVKDSDRFLQCFERSYKVLLVKTFAELEGKYMDYLSVLFGKKIVPVGPLVQDPSNEDEKKEVTEWLDQKEPSSTVFVSFGSEYFLPKEEREEVAHGLELSNANFIWVVRFPVGENMKLEDALPDGYLDRVSKRGLVLEGWAPQSRILAHSSTGGFVSHCGWSSIMESMKCGVPIIALPMHLDQPLNARLVEDVGVGIEAARNKAGGLEREEIARTIREVVVERSGEGVRRRAREMSDYIRDKGEEEMDAVVDELVQLSSS
ncbi:hypothetical protein Tsubulata_034597 [Turnera subulata]|uniref:Glycosyltransferase n=1 Tax=Turnera subulata TaxID=218843 RepID=A0A9Q0JJ62_9ROSI|nr:hypothetical protein Tsubulata_034597 [Turnera subulata]